MKVLHLQYYLLQIVWKLCFRQIPHKCSIQLQNSAFVALFFCGENVRFGNFVKGSKILQKVQKFTTSNCGARRISNVFACSCRYKTACILTCLGFVFCGENVRFGNFVKGSKILQKVQKFTTSNCGARRISNVFACSCRYKTACILTCLCAVL